MGDAGWYPWRHRGGPRRRGFTILELLLVVSIIALLLSILLPALSATRQTANDLKCKANLRSVVLQFICWADASGAGHRGQSDNLGPNIFRIEDFQESIYGVDEFWSGPATERLGMSAMDQPLMCPSHAGMLERRSGVPCSAGAVGPKKDVSIGFNKRLETRTRYIQGQPYPAPAYVPEKILHYPDVPVLFDVDGQEAVQRDLLPYYSAPPILDDPITDIYESGMWWFPSFRHRGGLNVGFVGGHVLSSSHPTTEPWWRWSYQPDP